MCGNTAASGAEARGSPGRLGLDLSPTPLARHVTILAERVTKRGWIVSASQDVPQQRTRLEQLREMVEGAETRMLSDSCTDQNFAVLGRMRADFLAQIAELGGEEKPAKETGLSDFEKRLRDRESGSKTPRRTAGK